MNHTDKIITRIHKAAKVLKLEPWLREKLCGFKLRWSCDLEVKMDNGALKQFRAVRIWHRSPHTDHPHKGGIRFHPDVSVDMMMSHAMEMSLKCWIMGLQFGGAKGGVAIDPSEYSLQEIKNVTEALVDELDERNILGPFRDVPAPDVGTDARIMNWIRQRYAQRRRSREDARFQGVVTGKPEGYGFGGLPGRKEATGFGLVKVLDTVIHLKKLDPKKLKRVALMGFGNVGRHAAQFLAQEGYKIIGLADSSGGRYRTSGFSLKELERADKVTSLKNAKKINNNQLLTLSDIDILVPAALENVITQENAPKINAKIIIEGANGPVTLEADEILHKRGILVIPDVLANAGGVTVSFFEWARNVNIRDERVPIAARESVLESLKNMLEEATQYVLERSKKYKVPLRIGAYILAIERAAPLFRTKHTAV